MLGNIQIYLRNGLYYTKRRQTRVKLEQNEDKKANIPNQILVPALL